MGSHPSSSELTDFLQGRISSRGRRREIVRHLLAGCPSCSALLKTLSGRGELPAFLADRRHDKPGPSRRSEYDYGAAFAAVERTLRFFLPEGEPVAEPPKAILAELVRCHDELEPELTALTPERSAIPFLVRWLVEKSYSCRFASPGDMLEWALLSRLVAESCSAAIAGSAAKLADLKARAEAQLANALRVLGRSDEAEDVMKSAWAILGRGSGDAELRASILRKEAAIFMHLRCFERTFDNLKEASALLSELGLRQELIETEVARAVGYHELGEYDRSVHLLEQAWPSISSAEDAYLPLVMRSNLIHNYVELGERKRALAAFSAARVAAGDWNQQDTLRLRLRWNEGKLLAMLGMPAAAERTLSRVRAGLLSQGMFYHLILVTRDLVRVQHELGHWDAAEQSIVSTSAQVHRRRSGPEVIQALQQLQSMS